MAYVDDIIGARSTMESLVKQQQSVPPSVLHALVPGQSVARVAQIEGERTNEEITDVVLESLHQVFNLPALEWIRFQYSDELLLCIRLALYKGSMWDRWQSVGDRMQNLVYRNEALISSSSSSSSTAAGGGAGGSSLLGPLALVTSPRLAPTTLQKSLHVLFSIIAPYLLRKALSYTVEHDWETAAPPLPHDDPNNNSDVFLADEPWMLLLQRVFLRSRRADGLPLSLREKLHLLYRSIRTRVLQRSWRQWAVVILRRASLWLLLAQFLHTLVFLIEGKYRSLTDRLLGLRLVYGGPANLVSALNISLVTQHVQYTSLQDLFEAVSPFWRGSRERVQHWASMFFGSLGSAVLPLIGGARQQSVSASQQSVGRSVSANPTLCVWCTQPCVMTQRANCGHVCCYYCVASVLPQREEERQRSGLVCPACHGPLRSFRPATF